MRQRDEKAGTILQAECLCLTSNSLRACLWLSTTTPLKPSTETYPTAIPLIRMVEPKVEAAGIERP